jgi:hypothetical protein
MWRPSRRGRNPLRSGTSQTHAGFECRIKNAAYAPSSITARISKEAADSCSTPWSREFPQKAWNGTLVCEGLPARWLRVSITVLRTASAKPFVPRAAGHDRAGRRQMRPVPRRWATSWREPISESRSGPAATPRAGSSPFPVYMYATPKWLNWFHPCHVACLERSTERSNSTLNDCNGRVLSSLASRGRLRHSDGGRRARLFADLERQLIARMTELCRSRIQFQWRKNSL